MNDAFLGKIKNHGFAFLPLARDVVKKKDICTFPFPSLYFLFQKQCNELVNIINEKKALTHLLCKICLLISVI